MKAAQRRGDLMTLRAKRSDVAASLPTLQFCVGINSHAPVVPVRRIRHATELALSAGAGKGISAGAVVGRAV